MTSFARDIRPLFTEEDVEYMLDVNPDLDLSSYGSVKANANDTYNTYNVLSADEIPPDDPWPKEQVDRLRQWMDEGYPA